MFSCFTYSRTFMTVSFLHSYAFVNFSIVFKHYIFISILFFLFECFFMMKYYVFEVFLTYLELSSNGTGCRLSGQVFNSWQGQGFLLFNYVLEPTSLLSVGTTDTFSLMQLTAYVFASCEHSFLRYYNSNVIVK
jgi:hypothetical protein